MKYEFGKNSKIVSYRYDEPPKVQGKFRGCVIKIQKSKNKEDNVSFRLKGYMGAISNLVGATNISISEGSDPNIEFERYLINYLLNETEGTMYCAECNEISS